MRIDYRPVEPPHVCNLPHPANFPEGTTIICEEITGHQQNGPEWKALRCNRRYRRTFDAWARMPVWTWL